MHELVTHSHTRGESLMNILFSRMNEYEVVSTSIHPFESHSQAQAFVDSITVVGCGKC